jgi:hypothetical protein
MYCPNCAAANNDDTKFCRVCGANLSLVPQALTGKLPKERSKGRLKCDDPSQAKHHRTPNIGRGIQHAFMGIGFLTVAIALSFFGGGRGWWFWLLIPAFGLLGTGIAEIVTAKLEMGSGARRAPIEPAPRAAEIPPINTGPIVPPPSVTEGTTRHLDPTTEPYKR